MSDSKDPKSTDAQIVGEHCIVNSDPLQRLSNFERLTLTGGDELERALGWASRGLGNLERMLSDVKLSLEEYHAALRYYSKVEQRFQAPAVSQLVEVPVHAFTDGQVLDLTFASKFSLAADALLRQYCNVWPEAPVYSRLWRHHGSRRPLILAIHGWTMGDQRLNSLAFLPGTFYRRGFDVLLVELPFHGRRRLDEKQLVAPAAQFFGTNEAIFQSISDLRQLVMQMKKLGYQKIGWIGVSLGSYLGAILATLEDFAFHVALVPLVSVDELAWQVLSKHPDFEEWQKQGLSRQGLTQIYGVHSPLAFEFKGTKSQALIIAGLNDAIVPSRQVKTLWEHWRRPELRWLQGGHGAQFYKAENYKSQMMQEVLTFVDKFLDS